MARTKKIPFPPWQTKKPDGIEKRFVRLGNSLLLDTACLKLSGNAFRLYAYMLLESDGKIEFEMPRHKYIKFMTQPTFIKSRDELIKKGFVEVAQNNANLRKANVYRFSSRWKDI